MRNSSSIAGTTRAPDDDRLVLGRTRPTESAHLAAAGHNRRPRDGSTLPGLGHGRHRQPRRARPALRPPGTGCRPPDQPATSSKRRSTAGASAGADHRGPRPGRRHRRRPIPNARRLGRRPWSSKENVRGYVPHASSAPDDQGRLSPRPDPPVRATPRGRLPSRPGEPASDPAGRVHVAQGGGQGDPRYQASPRRVDPRQGDGGGDGNRPLRRPRLEHPVHPQPGPGDEVRLRGWFSKPRIVAGREDGSFQIAVSPGKAHLLVFGPTGGYVARRDPIRPTLSYD